MDRFFAKVQITPSCWLWTAGRSGDGYGAFKLEGKQTSAHRASYQMHHGAIPPGAVVMHSCDNPVCVNPDHLSAGTTADNVADKVRKGRGRNGRESRTHCPRGHEYDYAWRGHRACKRCRR